MQRGRLVALGLGERGGGEQAAAVYRPGGLADGLVGVLGELEDIEGDGDVEAVVRVRQRVHGADAELAVGRALARDLDQLGRDVDPGHGRSECPRHRRGVARAAPDVEQSRTFADTKLAEHLGEQRLVGRLSQLSPVARTPSPVLSAHPAEYTVPGSVYSGRRN